MHLLALNRIARGGDGLAPEFLTLLARRDAIATDPKIVHLRSFNLALPDVAGDAWLAKPRVICLCKGQVRSGTYARSMCAGPTCAG